MPSLFPKGKFASALLLLACSGLLSQASLAQRGEEEPPPTTIDQRTGEALNEAIEFLNMDMYDEARAVLTDLNFERLSPFERGRVEQILSNIEYSLENYPQARVHMQASIDSGGLSAVEISTAKFYIAQLLVTEEKWAEGSAALEEWIATAEAPNSAAYYMLAAAYYQQDLFDKALPPARTAVELTDMPQEGWLSLLSSLLLQMEDYQGALPVVKQMVELFPDKKTYWLQLSSIYGTLEMYPEALAIMELAWHAGLLTEATEIRRLADLYQLQGSPYRAAELLSEHIDSGLIEADVRTYESLSNAWVAAREFRKSLPVLEQAAELSDDGNLYARLGEVNIQLEEWPAASAALELALDKGDLRDADNVQMLLGIAFYNQGNYSQARRWLEESAKSPARERTSRGYLQMIDQQEQG